MKGLLIVILIALLVIGSCTAEYLIWGMNHPDAPWYGFILEQLMSSK